MTIYLTETERDIRDALTTYYGIDDAGVIRMGLLELGREAGITAETVTAKKKSAPKH